MTGMNQYTRDNVILGVLIASVILWCLIGVGFLISFAGSGNPVFLIIAALFFVGAVVAGRAHTSFVIEVRAKSDAPRPTRSHRRHVRR